MTETRTTPTPRTPPTLPTPRSGLARAALGAVVLTLAVAAARLLLPPPPVLFPQLLPGWAPVVGALAGALAVLASARSAPPPAVRAALWGASALLLATAADGIAFDVIALVTSLTASVAGQSLPFSLPFDAAGSTVRVLSAGTAVLLGSRALAAQREARGSCAACGRGASGAARPTPAWPAYAACGLALGYAAEKVYWGLGGTLGLARDDAFGDAHLWTPGLGDTAVLALVGAAIALALVRPWGRRLPSWLLLAGAGLGALMLVPVGIMGTYGTLTRFSELVSSGGSIGLEPWVFLVQYPWFLAWGLTLGAAALSFHSRTRGRCDTCGRG